MSQLASRPQGTAIIATDAPKPLITAILVTRNKESYIRECLSSVMEQSVAERLEVIVVDEGSEQSEWAVIADLQKRHRNLISLRTPPGAETGTGTAMALKIASGRFITVLEASDRLKQDAYELLAAALEKSPEAMLAYGDTCFTAIPHESFAHHTSSGNTIWPDYTLQQLAQLSNQSQVAPHPLWRRELQDEISFCGTGDQGMRAFLLQVAERFPLLHVREFTSLKLVSSGGTHRDMSEREAVSQQKRPDEVRQPAPAGAARPAQPAPLAGADADSAYAAIQSLANGAEHLQAVSALEKHLEKHPEHAIAHNDLAATYYQLGESAKAVSHYRAAVRLSPNDSTYQKNLADLLYMETGQVDEAIEIYLQLFKAYPRDVETLLSLAFISEGVGQPAEAETFYQRALEIEPWNQSARERITALRQMVAAAAADEEETEEERYERSQALVKEGDLDGATRVLEGLLASYPDFPPAHNDLAVLYYENGDKIHALAHYKKAASLAPGNSTFQKNLADFYFVEERDVDSAIEIYLELLRKEPKNIETLMSLGKICTLVDRPHEAETFYGKVTQLEPWNRDARECLSTLRHCANS